MLTERLPILLQNLKNFQISRKNALKMQKKKRAEEKKEQAAKAQKKTYVQANSLEELEKKIKEIDWDSVEGEGKTGDRRKPV